MLRPAFHALAAIVACFVCQAATAADINASADTFVDGATAETRVQNYGTHRTIRLRNSGQRISLVRFSNLPAAAPSRAELILRVDTVNVAGMVELARINSAWSETAVTFNTRPSIQSTAAGGANIGSSQAGSTVTIDVTGLVQQWIANPSSNLGVAIRATAGSPAQVYFASREGGFAPRLRLTSDTDNEVTVAPSGGDYTDPVVAANNAYQGDTWCVNPTAGAPCRMSIAAGHYFLDNTLSIPPLVFVNGASIKHTFLLARPGVEIAVQMGSREELRDLTVIQRQAEAATVRGVVAGNDGAPGSTLLRVAVHASGTQRVTAVELVPGFNVVGGVLTVRDCEITVSGFERASGIATTEGADLRVSDTRISADGGNGEAAGIAMQTLSPAASAATLQDVDVIAESGAGVSGIGVGGGGGAVTIEGGTVSVKSALGGASGVDARGNAVSITGTGVVANAATFGEAFRVQGFGSLTRVSADAPDFAMRISEGRLHVDGAYLKSRGEALQISGMMSSSQPLLNNSFLDAPTALEIANGERPNGSFLFRSSVLAGSRSIPPGQGHTCDRVYDENYQPLNSHCQ